MVDMSMIALDKVSKTYPGARLPAVDRLTLEVAEGEVVVLVGPSGCGKTTTLKMINRIVEPTSGRITVAGRDVSGVSAPELRRGIGYVIQHVGLFAHRTVAENIATVPRLLGWDARRIGSRVDELVELVGLEAGMVERYPDELSGGQQQRVGVARALAADPPVLLMDEPFGAVDPIVRARLQDELVALQARLHKTIVFVTHDVEEAIKLADRVVILNTGAAVEQFASPLEVLARPASDFVTRFVGTGRWLKRLSLLEVGDLDLGAVQTRGPHAYDPARSTLDPASGAGAGAGDGDGDGDGLVVEADASLLVALEALLSERASSARVVGDDGRDIGTVTLDAITAQMR